MSLIVIPGQTFLSARTILDAAIREGGTESLAELFDRTNYPGVLKKWAEMVVLQTFEILNRAMRLTPNRLAALSDPYAFFDTKDQNEAAKLIMQRFTYFANSSSPPEVIRAMMAHVELGLGNFREAAVQAGFALNEAEVSSFGKGLMAETIPYRSEARGSLLRIERMKAELLVRCIEERSWH